MTGTIATPARATLRRAQRQAPTPWRAWLGRPAVHDALLAVALLGLSVLVNAPTELVLRTAESTEVRHVDVLPWWSATGLLTVAVALRRRWPLPLLAVCTVATATHLIRGAPFAIIDLGVAVLLSTVAARYRRVLSLTVLGVLLALVTVWNVVAAATGRPVPGLPDLVPTSTPPGMQMGSAGDPARIIAANTWTGTLVLGSILVASWATGAAARSRRAYLDELHGRAEDLERERDQRGEIAAAAERARISRELHDVVAHGLSVMVTQAQGAQAALEKRPDATRAALAAIIKTGRESLADMRQALARADGVHDAWHPQPGLSQLPALVSQVSSAGTSVRLLVHGRPSELPSAVDRSAYRIVQEALTNTMKHAGPGAQAAVSVTYHQTDLNIEIRDNGQGSTASDGRGTGLRGMRERVRLLGGDFSAGTRPGGGFAVRAVFPLGNGT
jgi:signal transduction histidine kinase